MNPRIEPYGDSALLVSLPSWSAAQRFADAAEVLPCVVGVVATYDSVLVEFDCGSVGHVEVAAALRSAVVGAAADLPPPRVIPVPVAYGGEHGPDLDAVAAELGLAPGELVERHAAARWVVRFLGAPAGAPMLDGSPFAAVPRHARPRTAVPAGSVALAGEQGVIYPVRSPGGWRIVGRTPVPLTLPCRPGDVLRFEPARP